MDVELTSSIKVKRDDFKYSTIRTMAERVGWRCSFPGCSRLTVGAHPHISDKPCYLGMAAHITAASQGGPRYDGKITASERKSLSNGIWMCPTHGSLIDKDELQYSVATLRQWKDIAEKAAFSLLEQSDRDERQNKIIMPTTLVQLGDNLIFEAMWHNISQENWSFQVEDQFIKGSLNSLQQYCLDYAHLSSGSETILVESQGDGRLLAASPSLSFIDRKPILTIPILPKLPRISPHEVGQDIGLNSDGDLYLDENNDLAFVSGIAAAEQDLTVTLQTRIGELMQNPNFGTKLHRFIEEGYDVRQLRRLTKLEIARLATLPIPHLWISEQSLTPLFNYVNRVLSVDIQINTETPQTYLFNIAVVWGDGSVGGTVVQLQL